MKVSRGPNAAKPDGADLLTEPTLSAVPGVVHGFTTRRGGVSHGALSSLNLARRPAETDEALKTNWDRVCAALGHASEQLVLLEQVHGVRCIVATAATGPLDTLPPADAAVTDRQGLLLAVRVADCVPVLFATEGAVGVAHAGWRGVVGGIAGETVSSLSALAGVPPERIRAVVGPCISGPAYQVDRVVADALVDAGGGACLTPDGPGHWLADLRAEVTRQLRDAGVVQIGHIQRCTARHPEHYSHRADGPHTGRQAGVVGLC